MRPSPIPQPKRVSSNGKRDVVRIGRFQMLNIGLFDLFGVDLRIWYKMKYSILQTAHGKYYLKLDLHEKILSNWNCYDEIYPEKINLRIFTCLF